MIKKIIKRDEGIGAIDGIVAIAIFAIFTTLVVSMIYNIYINSNFITRNSRATNYIITIFENIEKMPYSEIGFDDVIFRDNLNILLDETDGIIETTDETSYYKCIKGGYTITVYVENYIPDEDSNHLDIVKKIRAKVEYKLGTKNKTLEMYKLKALD